jgi:hypothetical protein
VKGSAVVLFRELMANPFTAVYVSRFMFDWVPCGSARCEGLVASSASREQLVFEARKKLRTKGRFSGNFLKRAGV